MNATIESFAKVKKFEKREISTEIRSNDKEEEEKKNFNHCFSREKFQRQIEARGLNHPLKGMILFFLYLPSNYIPPGDRSSTRIKIFLGRAVRGIDSPFLVEEGIVGKGEMYKPPTLYRPRGVHERRSFHLREASLANRLDEKR